MEGQTTASASLIGLLQRVDAARSCADALKQGTRTIAMGAAGSSTHFLAGAVATETRQPVVLVVAHGNDAEIAVDELEQAGVRAIHYPALEVLPGESNVSMDLLLARFDASTAVRHLRDQLNNGQQPSQPTVVVCAVQGLMQPIPEMGVSERFMRTVARGQDLPMQQLIQWLADAGYRRLEAIEEPGDFAVRGGIVDIFGPAGRDAIRLDFFGDELDSITELDTETLAAGAKIEQVDLVCAEPDEAVEHTTASSISLLDLLPRNTIGMIAEPMEVTEQARGYFERVIDGKGIFGPPAVFKKLNATCSAIAEVCSFAPVATAADVRVELPVEPLPEFDREIGSAMQMLARESTVSRVMVFCQTPGELQRFGELLAEHAPDYANDIESMLAFVHRGFRLVGDDDTERAMVVPYHELVHRFGVRRKATNLRKSRAMDTFLDFAPGDVVVHAEHGIAIFVGVTLLEPRHVKDDRSADDILKGRGRTRIEPEEFLVLEFANKARLNVPAIQIDQVQKYVGGFKGKPPLSTLGGQKWSAQKQKVFESVRDLAAELLRVRAARESLPGIRYPADTTWQKEFEAEFPYQETEDQLAALSEIKRDQTSERPMDRLLCGDVGFGKTELAIRAAFKVVESGRQVAVLVPTTVLAEQHERTFRDRFASYPFRVESISRFKTGKEINNVLKELKQGRIDIIIGTHRLLSKDVRFADLGLVVIDEEQRFGVEHKEQLLTFRMTADVLTLSATPIPRTLHMSLLGLRDISSLATAPTDRQSVVTEVIPWNAVRLKQAVARELARDGQVFYLHNRVHDIQSAADEVQKLAPDARIVVGHGQMSPRELEQVMLRFIRHDADILVSTTIIESGIDIPNANTICIADADRFGLADLHQLRGRVGRSRHRAYCYLLLPLTRTVQDKAKRRLKAMEEYHMLGAGFKIAMRDLEIRGAGNLLGAEQSGHIAVVGYDMYCKLLEEAVNQLEHRDELKPQRTQIEIGLTGSIPRSYINAQARRLEAYRRIAQASNQTQVEKVRSELESAYGKPPKSTQRLLDLAELRVLSAAVGILSMVLRGPDVLIKATDARRAADALGGIEGTVRVVESERRGKEAEEDRRTMDIYIRLPQQYLEVETLARVLTRRFASAVQRSGSVEDRSVPLPNVEKPRLNVNGQ
ncbi:MAG: transcription-repair coupling factor [Phycisphaeraceae bacterium]|nr:transcription-repair coupling factor [Phycisphaerales bacterium]MCB9860354.1 transcription-repair coupling factor [Phycisphaeraceae bacterium]